MTEHPLLAMVGLTGALLFGLAVACGAIVIVPMLGDAPGAVERRGVQFAMTATFALPVIVGIALIGAWGLYFVGVVPPVTCLACLLPLLHVGIITVAYPLATEKGR